MTCGCSWTGLLRHPSAVTVAAGVAQNRRRELLAWTIAAMAGLALVVLWAWSLRRPIPDVRTHVSSALPPPGVSLETDEAPAISPDGSRLLFVGHDSTGKQLLYTLALDVAGPGAAAGKHRRRLVALLVTGQPIGRILWTRQAQDG